MGKKGRRRHKHHRSGDGGGPYRKFESSQNETRSMPQHQIKRDLKPNNPSSNAMGGSIFDQHKRAVAAVSFVYSKKKGKKPYIFSSAKVSHGVQGTKSEPNVESTSDERRPKKKEKEGIDNILRTKKKGKKGSNASKPWRPNLDAIPESDRSDVTAAAQPSGRLSGISVEEVVRDKVGLRPRANSTDGELNLPQRGLCDERMVLESYKWLPENVSTSLPKGFVNLGNTCFLNSTVQCLAYLPPFCQSLLAMPKATPSFSKLTPGKRITHILRTLFSQVHGTNGPSHPGHALAPKAMVRAVPSLSKCGSQRGYKFRPGRQEDAHEFLVHLLDAMNDGELREAGINQNSSGWRDRLPVPRLDETTFVHRIFGGYFRSQVKCSLCNYESNTYDPFLDLALEVSRKSCHSLADAFQQFTRKEQLDSENKWKCSGCKKKVCASKQLTVFRPPLSLCIQLKRFSFGSNSMLSGFGGGRGGGMKISKQIEFPSTLKLSLSNGRSCGYSLTGAVIHVGGHASSGHYTAYVRKPMGERKYQWYHMDDSSVEACSERKVLRQRDAYLLFYSREEVKLELPTVPMSSKEAVEFGRVKARSRANSFTGDSNENEDYPTGRPALQANGQPIIDSRQEKPAHSSSPKQPHKLPGNLDTDSDSSAEQDAREKKQVHASNPKQPHKLPEDRRNHANDRDSSVDQPKSSSTASEPVESKDVDAIVQKSFTKNVDCSPSEKESRESPKPNNGTVIMDKIQPPTKPSNPTLPKNEIVATEQQGVEGDPRKTPGNAELNQSQKAATSKATPKDDKVTADVNSSSSKKRKTITVNRGDGREKVEFVVSSHKQKSWQPKASVRSKSDDEYALLGNQKIDKWGDDDDEDNNVNSDKHKHVRTKIAHQVEKKASDRKRKLFLGRWDSILDQGRTKKVKQKPSYNESESGVNPFDRIQQSIQIMTKKGRRDGTIQAKKRKKSRGSF